MWKAPAMPPNPAARPSCALTRTPPSTSLSAPRTWARAPSPSWPRSPPRRLGVPYEWVRISVPVDTKYSPYEWQTVASRITWSTGNAVKAAAEDARRQILEVVAELGRDPSGPGHQGRRRHLLQVEEEQPLQGLVVYGLPNEGLRAGRAGPSSARAVHAHLRHQPRL
jgi:hypothetical protein